MIRREFVKLTAGSVVALGGSLFLVSCGGSGGANADDPAAPPEQLGSAIRYTTSIADGHFHTFLLATSAFTSPPTDGVTGPTTEDNTAHQHTVAISMAQLQSVGAGQTVKVTTGSTAGHTHVVTLLKLG